MRYAATPKLMCNEASEGDRFSFRAAKRQGAEPLGQGQAPPEIFQRWLAANCELNDFGLESALASLQQHCETRTPMASGSQANCAGDVC
ncbi:hypothetical protein SAMN06265222_1011022 [Neorhodopirellula lusitana]|uniref:Uncharacterized protein n=1 Tax=Neorhodopirellula lusitana TaxID=445327 RepID=A0ABY1PUD2_9BACT|nr:hypothetical protein SAMN06265222_1011022 [Neorhodopirellula lusitana]